MKKGLAQFGYGNASKGLLTGLPILIHRTCTVHFEQYAQIESLMQLTLSM